MAKKKGIATILEDAAKEPAVQAVVASTAVATGAIAGKLVHDRVERAEREQQRRYRLDPDQPAGPEVKRVLVGQLDQAIECLESGDGAGPPETIHEARKALKRSRAALRLSRPLIGTQRYRRENQAVRDAGRGLSELRDAQMLAESLEGLGGPGRFAGFRQALLGPGHDGQGTGQAAEVRPRLEQTRGRIARWRLPGAGGPEELGQGFERIYRRGRKALKAARREPSVENLHELRKRAKDLWHAAQLLGPRQPQRAAKLARRAHELSDLLGSDHDLAILHERALADPSLLGPAELEQLESLIEHRRAELQHQALACAKRLYRRKPGKLVRRLALI